MRVCDIDKSSHDVREIQIKGPRQHESDYVYYRNDLCAKCRKKLEKDLEALVQKWRNKIASKYGR